MVEESVLDPDDCDGEDVDAEGDEELEDEELELVGLAGFEVGGVCGLVGTAGDLRLTLVPVTVDSMSAGLL